MTNLSTNKKLLILFEYFLCGVFILKAFKFPFDAEFASLDAAVRLWMVEVCCVWKTRQSGGAELQGAE